MRLHGLRQPRVQELLHLDRREQVIPRRWGVFFENWRLIGRDGRPHPLGIQAVELPSSTQPFQQRGMQQGDDLLLHHLLPPLAVGVQGRVVFAFVPAHLIGQDALQRTAD